ncbi:hypothetical protein BH23GEM5_BH23GEM5_23670 [soil metagenome]|jgi:hypothetical protein
MSVLGSEQGRGRDPRFLRRRSNAPEDMLHSSDVTAATFTPFLTELEPEEVGWEISDGC